MAENRTINIKINQNADKAEQSFKSYNKELGNTKKQYDAVLKSGKPFDQQLEDINRIVKETPLNVRDMNKQIQAYQSIALSAGRETPVGKQALEQAAQLRDRYIDIQNETKRLADDQRNLEGAIQGISTGVAIYGGVQSALALTGVESEKLRETLVKLQAAQTLMNSINQVATALEKESALMLTLKSARTKALTAATGAYAAVTGTATGALKVFRLALISTGIGAIVVAIGLLVANFDKLKSALGGGTEGFKKLGTFAKLALLPFYPLIKAIELVKAGLEKLNILNTEQEKQIERQLDLQNEQLEITKQQIAKRLEQIKLEARYRDNRVKNLELDLQSAKNDEERAKIQAQITKETLDGFEAEREAIRANQKTAITNANIRLNNLKKQYNEEANSIFVNQEKLNKYYKYVQDQERYLSGLKKQFADDNFQSIVEIDTKQREYLENQRREEEEKEKESNKKKQDDYKNYLQNRLNARRKIEDLENALLEDGIDKELEINKDKFDRLIEDTKKNTKLTREERNRLIELYEEQGQQKAEEIRAKYRQKQIDAERKLQQQIEADKNAFLDEIAAIEEGNYQALLSDQERELRAVQDKYFRLQELAQGNAEALNAIEIARLNEENEINLKYQEEQYNNEKAINDKKRADEKALQEYKINVIQGGLSAINDIAQLFAKGNERQQKRAFQIQKAVGIAQATINTAQAITKVFAETTDFTPTQSLRIANAVAIGVAGAAQIAAIASQQFEGGGNVESPSGAIGGGETIAPEFNVVGESGINQLAQLQQQPVQAYVVSGEVTTGQALDRNRVQNATL